MNSEKTFYKLAVNTALLPVHFYRYVISPLTPASCRHVPTCSQYAIEAVKRFGLINGGAMAANRISRCHPWGTSGYDPVPIFVFQVFLTDTKKCSRLKPPKNADHEI
ncbi:MAG: membrane protein insertion efficiency factor YidD [Bacteroidales bacterium]|nr:membrane protein insertion efficiency factor YidD [Bacteroidales bacterium]